MTPPFDPFDRDYFEELYDDELDEAFPQVNGTFPDTAYMREAGKVRSGFRADSFGLDEWEPDGDELDDRFGGDDDPHVRAALRKPITDFGGWRGDWDKKVLPPPPPPPKPKAVPKPCANGDGNPAESKLKTECVACRKYRERTGKTRPVELVHKHQDLKAGDGAQAAHTDRLIDGYAEGWLAREEQIMGGDPLRAHYAETLAREEAKRRVLMADIGGDIADDSRRKTERSRRIEEYGGEHFVDESTSKALWKAVQRRYHILKKKQSK